MSDAYKQEKTTIVMPDLSVKDVDCGTGDAEGCLRNKVRIAALEQRIANLEKLLGVKP
jgi:hypothetical protein